MSDLTPETMRKSAALEDAWWVEDWAEPFASAWEADIIAWCDVTEERDVLRKHIEALEREIAGLASTAYALREAEDGT